MYVYYQTKYPNLVFADKTLKNFLHNNLKELKTINFNEEKVWKGNILMWWNVGTFELAINEYASKDVLKDVKIWWMSYIGR
jgi:hypothetical protein